MSDFNAYLFVTLGVIVAVVLPVLAGFIRREFPRTARVGLPPWVKKYGALLLFSLLTALPVLAIYLAQEPEEPIRWYTAFLLGFAWESALEKFASGAR